MLVYGATVITLSMVLLLTDLDMVTAFSAVLAVAIGMQFLPQSQSAPTAQPAAATNVNTPYVDGATALDENPDLYLWLASQDAATLAME